MTTTIQLDYGDPVATGTNTSTRGREPTRASSGNARRANSPLLAETIAAAAAKVVNTLQWTVLIDSQEQVPYTFTGLFTDAGQSIAVPTQVKRLGIGWGDYSIRGMEPDMMLRKVTAHQSELLMPGEPPPVVSIERKSMSDAHSTFLGWRDNHRDNFERELSQLNGLTFAAVVVECTEGELYRQAPEWGRKTAAENRKSLSRSIDSWRMRWNRVQWLFADDRRMAEIKTFRLLEKFWREHHAK